MTTTRSCLVHPLCIAAALALVPGCRDRASDDTGETADGGSQDGGSQDGGSSDGGSGDGGSGDGGAVEPTPGAPRFRAVVLGGSDIVASEGHGVNADGVLAGTAVQEVDGASRWVAFRMQPDGSVEVAGGEQPTGGMAIDAEGTVAGVQYGAVTQAFRWSGTGFELLGAPIAGGGSHGWAVDAGVVAGSCTDPWGVASVCLHVPGEGWRVGELGALYGLGGDRAVGLGTVDGWALQADLDLAIDPLFPADPIGDVAYAVSPDGRFVVGTRAIALGLDPGAGWWIDLERGEHRVVPDLDDNPLRDSAVHLRGVAAEGHAVGSAHDGRGADVAFLYDPWSGRSWDLGGQLVEPLPDDMVLVDARDVEGAGWVAATAWRPADNTTHAVLLEPVEPLSSEPAEGTLESPPDGAPTYLRHRLDPSEDAPPSWAVGFGPDGSPWARYARERLGAWHPRTGRLDGSAVALAAAGDAVPVAVGADGALVGYGRVLDLHTDLVFVHGFRADLDGEVDLGREATGSATFAHAADSAGRVVGECWTEEGAQACLNRGAGWEILGPGRALGIGGDVVVGEGDSGAMAWLLDDTEVSLPGTLATAVSPDGRWLAGTGERAWLLDQESGRVRALPDLDGDEAGSGLVVPLAVGADGAVVGQAAGPRGEARAFRWAVDDVALTALDLVAPGEERLLAARAVDGDGHILVDALDAQGLPRATWLQVSP